MRFWDKSLRHEDGATAVEYGLIVALIAVGMIGSLNVTRTALVSTYGCVAAVLGAGSGSCGGSDATSTGGSGTTTASNGSGTGGTSGSGSTGTGASGTDSTGAGSTGTGTSGTGSTGTGTSGTGYTTPTEGALNSGTLSPTEYAAQTNLPPGYTIVHSGVPEGAYNVVQKPWDDPTVTYLQITAASNPDAYRGNFGFSEDGVSPPPPYVPFSNAFVGTSEAGFDQSLVGANPDGTYRYIYAVQDPSSGLWAAYQVVGPDDGSLDPNYGNPDPGPPPPPLVLQ